MPDDRFSDQPPRADDRGSNKPPRADDRVSSKPLPLGSGGDVQVPEPSSLPSLAQRGGEGGLSSLAQSAREKQLRTARSTMIVVGVLTVLVNIGAAYLLKTSLETAGGVARNLPPEVEHQVFLSYLSHFAFGALGVIFIILGALVYTYPVPCTVTGLTLFVLAWLGSIAVNPVNIFAGIIFKIIIVVFLFRAVQAALAYERERAAPEVD